MTDQTLIEEKQEEAWKILQRSEAKTAKNKENVKIKGHFIRVPTGGTVTTYVWLDIAHVQYVTESSYKDMCHVAFPNGEIDYVNLSAEELVDIIMSLEE